MRKRCIFSTALFLILSGFAYAQDTYRGRQTTDGSEVEYEVRYDFKPRLRWYEILFKTVTPFETVLTVNLPQTIPGRQEVTRIEFDPDPNRIFDQNGNKYADFAISVSKKNVSVKIHVEAKIFRYDLATVMEGGQTRSDNEPNQAVFLRPERLTESNDALVQRLAQDINGTNELEIVRGVYDFVINYLDFDFSKIKGVGAAKTAQSKKGMCIDYCDLFTAMCRVRGIPARVVAGYQTIFHISPKHSWVEVYFRKYGWVPLDPSQWKASDENSLDYKFYHLEPKLLCFTRTRNDTVLQYNYFYSISRFDKETFDRIYPPVETIKFTKPALKKHDSRQDIERTKKKAP